LRCIDAANTRAINAEDIELDVTPAGGQRPPFWKRLSDGFNMIQEDARG